LRICVPFPKLRRPTCFPKSGCMLNWGGDGFLGGLEYVGYVLRPVEVEKLRYHTQTPNTCKKWREASLGWWRWRRKWWL
jgi:hypothetical protein